MVPVSAYVVVSAILFVTGLAGVLIRRNFIIVMMSVEIMLNAANINLVAFARFGGNLLGQAFALFGIALAVAEVGVGLAIVILLYRTRADIEPDAARDLRG